MKHIKTFEQNSEKQFIYWEIGTTDAEWKISLERIKDSYPEYKELMESEEEYCTSNPFVDGDHGYIKFVYITHQEGDACGGWWNAGNDEELFNDFKDDNLNMGYVEVDMGRIVVTPEEIEQWKLDNNVNNFNI